MADATGRAKRSVARGSPHAALPWYRLRAESLAPNPAHVQKAEETGSEFP
jgi:hypothetical protein